MVKNADTTKKLLASSVEDVREDLIAEYRSSIASYKFFDCVSSPFDVDSNLSNYSLPWKNILVSSPSLNSEVKHCLQEKQLEKLVF